MKVVDLYIGLLNPVLSMKVVDLYIGLLNPVLYMKVVDLYIGLLNPVLSLKVVDLYIGLLNPVLYMKVVDLYIGLLNLAIQSTLGLLASSLDTIFSPPTVTALSIETGPTTTLRLQNTQYCTHACGYIKLPVCPDIISL